jgi:excisionase family DNA binding protein
VSGPVDTPELEALRRVIREEIGRAIREMATVEPAYLRVREAAKRYRVSYDTVRALIESGGLSVVKRPYGRGGRFQYMILASDAALKLPSL